MIFNVAFGCVKHGKLTNRTRIVVGVTAAAIFIVGVPVFIIIVARYAFRMKKLRKQDWGKHPKSSVMCQNDTELSSFSLQSILDGTDFFSDENKLGEGGFGPVYKGYILENQEVAIKRLSKKSSQGVEEFMNELIAILQHKNLVRLLGSTCLTEALTKSHLWILLSKPLWIGANAFRSSKG